MTNGYDPYAPTRYQESNAILLAGMYVNDDDDEALTRLEELLRDMEPGELTRLATAAKELHDFALAARRVMLRERAARS